MFRARSRTESVSRPTSSRGSVGSARVWDERTRALRLSGGAERAAPPQPELALAPGELSALITGIVAFTLDARLPECEPARRALLARELEMRLLALFQPLPDVAEPAPLAAPAELPADDAPVSNEVPPVVRVSSPMERALELALEHRLGSLGGPIAERTDLRRLLVELALGALEPAGEPGESDASQAELGDLDLLQRRALKLERALKDARAALAYVSGLEHVDEGLASIYRTVQGLGLVDPQRARKREALEGIFRANLALQKPDAGSASG